MNNQSLMHEISRLRQKRQHFERRCEMTGKMLSACLIYRSRMKGKREFQPVETIGSNIEYKSYGYLTCFYNGRNICRYIRKHQIGDVERLTSAYRIFCENMKQVRELNRRILEVLDKIGKNQKEEVKNYVKKRTGRIKKKERTK